MRISSSYLFSDVVLEARPWPIFMVLASGPMALASKVQALALRASLTIFCHHHRTHGPTTTTNIKLRVYL